MTGSQFDARLARLKVLVAEDEPMNRLIIKAIFKILGSHVTMVGNGHEAVAACLTSDFDVILLDQHMPECDGITATRLIRAHEQVSGGHIPILCTSAITLADERGKFIEAGMDEFLDKPLRIEDVASKLMRGLKP